MTSELQNWVVEVNAKLSNTVSVPEKEEKYASLETCIYRVDDAIRKNFRESDYTPRIASFGPYYYGRESCEPTQRLKENVLLHFLKKSNKRLDDCTEALTKNVPFMKEHYSELDPKWQQDDDAFLQLMILDACFLLEIAREGCKSLEADPWVGDYKSDSPVWGVEGLSITELREYYIHDMLLLENQIPLFVLYLLCEVEINDPVEATNQVKDYILKLVSPFPWATKTIRHEGYYHVLDLYRTNLLFPQRDALWIIVKSIIPCFPSGYIKTASATQFRFSIPSATELAEGGIRFTTSKTVTLWDISFRGRTLRLPQISMHGATRSIFLNIIAFERYYEYAEKEVTSYIYFMSRILRDVADVKLLESRGIIHRALSYDEIIEVFNSLTTKDIMRDPDNFLIPQYKSMGQNLRKSYNKMSNEWRKDLWQNYLRSPFAVVSVIAAFLLFALTIIQTVYTVLGYYNPK